MQNKGNARSPQRLAGHPSPNPMATPSDGENEPISQYPKRADTEAYTSVNCSHHAINSLWN